MKRWGVSLFLAAACTALGGPNPEPDSAGAGVEVSGGHASFEAPTSIGAVVIHGKSDEVLITAHLKETAERLSIAQMDAKLAVSTLRTGMAIRDRRMRDEIFKTGDGQFPDLMFSVDNSECSHAPSREVPCEVTGKFTLRGVTRPMKVSLKIRDNNGHFHVSGDGIVKLSDFGIKAPAQPGVHMLDDVQFHVEFNAVARQSVAGLGGMR